MTHRPSFKDPALQAQFDRDGYTTAPMLDADQVASLLAEYALLRPADGFAPDGSGVGNNTYHFSILDDSQSYRREAHELIRRYFLPVLDRYLVDNDILMANFTVKPAGSGNIPPHQNWPVLPDQNDTSVTIWCPLVDADVTNGTLHVTPGSHKLLHHIEGPISPPYFMSFEDRLYNHLKPLPTPAGSGVMFDDGLLHGSPANQADTPRIAVQITCVPASSKPVFFFNEVEQHFELIDASKEFYLQNDVAQLFVRQPEWRGRGHFKSRNRQIDEAEFLALLADGENIRRRGFEPLEFFDPAAPGPAPVAAPTASSPAPLWRRVARRIKRTLARAA